MTTPTPVHYLRANERDYTPAAVIFADTETRPVTRQGREVLTLRLWSARYVDRRTRANRAPRDVTADGRTAAEFADWVAGCFKGRESITLYTHNLAFDVATTRLPMRLVAAGWETRAASLVGASPWFILSKARKTLRIANSVSWLPIPLEEVGVKIGHPKLPLPAPDAPEGEWLARCRGDVAILADAMLQLMDWWDRDRLGNWSMTGTACGWNAYRHRPAAWPVLIDPEPDKIAGDRLAVHGGRRGIWTVGEHGAGPFADLDFVAAYPTIAAHCPVPIARGYTFRSLPLDDRLVTSARYGIAAHVRLETDSARWPVRVGNQTWYPVGQFWADLAGEDIHEAHRLGALREIGPGAAHRVEPAMADWARWVLAVQHGQDSGAPAIAQPLAKAWGRSVLGRWAQRGHTRTMLGPAPGSGWGREEGWDHDTGTPGAIVDVAGIRYWVSNSGETDNAYPAIFAWIEAEVRARLGRVIDALGPRAVLQADTDGCLVAMRLVGTRAAGGTLQAPDGMTPEGRLNWCLAQLDPVTAPLELRIKATHSRVEVLGPQHLRLDSQRRFAGMPRTATETGPDTYTAHIWPGLEWQLEHGDAAGYVRPERTYTVHGPYPSGWITRGKRVVPPEARITATGDTELVPWSQTRYARAGITLADVQHPALEAIAW